MKDAILRKARESAEVKLKFFEENADAFDIALGISTSGASANVNRALKRASELGLLTVGVAGRDGGKMAEVCEHCFTVKSWSIHRVHETHTVLLHLLWDLVHVAMGEDDVI
jgi:D-sedoheptulose 7-phosphate isomerase